MVANFVRCVVVCRKVIFLGNYELGLRSTMIKNQKRNMSVEHFEFNPLSETVKNIAHEVKHL
jgi:hypothetical protein